MVVVRLDLSYDGTGFRGYAKQPGQRTIQGELDSALSRVFDAAVDTAVAGRTDAGVHARHQVVSFRAENVNTTRLQRSLNAMLGDEIVVNQCALADDGFNARFSARRRTYRYAASIATYPDPMLRNQIWFLRDEIEVDLLNRAAEQFVGEIDFTSFCRSVQGRSNIRRVERSIWEIGPDGDLWYSVEANAFCHQMVRSLVGACYDVARGYFGLDDLSTIIAGADRSTTGTVAPPHGLSLWEVSYD